MKPSIPEAGDSTKYWHMLKKVSQFFQERIRERTKFSFGDKLDWGVIWYMAGTTLFAKLYPPTLSFNRAPRIWSPAHVVLGFPTRTFEFTLPP